jgi:hypothetical protein
MRCFCLLLAIASLAWSATDDWREVLNRVRANVASQVAKSANYTCVETIDRTEFGSSRDLLPGCAYESKLPQRIKIMHDRLRLDVAVSEGREIFSWHGQSKFSGSSRISDVVRRGTVSSGEFIGFLSNVFLQAGIRFQYTGQANINGVRSYSFNYTVPLATSGYHVDAKQGKSTVPFHGSFSVRGSDFELASLSVIADDIPENSLICSAETEMIYQIAKISGQDALIPSLFILKLDDINHQYTVSRSEYTACRAFGAESTLRFGDADSTGSESLSGPVSEQQLPPGTLLHIGLRTPVDDTTSFTGDPVEGALLDSIKVRGVRIPKNAVVNGVVTMLENFDQPVQHRLIRIDFGRLTFAHTAFVFHAAPQPSKLEAKKLTDIYGSPWPYNIQELYDSGVFVFRSNHVHLDEQFSANWVTQASDAAPSANSTAGAR